MSTEEWTANLKPGDDVYIPNRYSGGRIAKVDRRTPKGFIVVGRQTFNERGFLRGGRSWDDDRIEPVTDLARAKVERHTLTERIISRTERGDINAWAIEDLRRVFASLPPEKKGSL